MDRSFPTRKRYTYELPTIHWNIILQFGQATSNQTRNEYNNLNSMSIDLFTKRYMGILKWWCIWYEKKRYTPTFFLWKQVEKDIDKVFADIARLRYVIRGSIYHDYPEVKPEKGSRKRALHNIDSFLAEKCNCSIEDVRNILTDEQIWFMLDDNKRDYYETFPSWMSVNDTILNKNWWNLSQQDEEMLQYMRAYKERAKWYKKT